MSSFQIQTCGLRYRNHMHREGNYGHLLGVLKYLASLVFFYRSMSERSSAVVNVVTTRTRTHKHT